MQNLTRFVLLPLLCFSMPVFAAVSGFSAESLFQLLIQLVILGVVFWIVNWALGYIGVPEPFNKVIRVILVVIVVVILVNILLGLAGHRLF